LEEAGVQATPRNARIDVEDVCHVVMNIGPSAAPCSATKERTSAEDAPGLPIGPPRGPFCAGRAPRDRFWGRKRMPWSTSCFMPAAARSSLLWSASFYARVFAAPDPGWREYGGGW